MKKNVCAISIAIILLLFGNKVIAQTTAMNFNRKDCNGNNHHLFELLDSGNVVILEFFMQNCNPCIVAGGKLESMKAKLLAKFPGKIKAFAIGYNNSYSCSSNSNWVSSNGFTSVAMDSGSAQVAYYGGMGMPTIVVLGGGTQHLILGSPYIGFSTNDTSQMVKDIMKSFQTTGIKLEKTIISGFNLYPNPLNNELNLKFDVSEQTQIRIDITDITGKSILTWMNETVVSGPFERTFDSSVLPEGYFVINVSTGGVKFHYQIAISH